jgi:prepilin-type N-terminal cleavage/methylation domain-containing protein
MVELRAEGERLSQMVREIPTAGTVSKRLRDQRGFTLIETLVVMLILLVVVGALVDGFVSASHAEVDQVARAGDQQAVREALVRMSKDIHCATGAGVTTTVDPMTSLPTAGLLNLQIQSGACIAVTSATSGASGVQWCTAAIGSSGKRYGLYRTDVTPSGTSCDPANANFQVDFLTKPDIWSQPACSSGRIQTIAVDLPTNRDPVKRPNRSYELKDTIALRNAPACN